MSPRRWSSSERAAAPCRLGDAAPETLTLRDAARTWARIGLLSFGGPAGQIALMHRVLVEEKRWLSEARFLHALNYCMLLPGPEAQQLATYIGWLLHRTAGGLVAGLLFILPGALTMLVLSVLYAGYRQVEVVDRLFWGIKPVVIAIVLEAVMRIGKRALKHRIGWGIAGLAFLAIFVFEVPFPIIILGAALLGWSVGRLSPSLLAGPPPKAGGAVEGPSLVDGMLARGELDHTHPSRARAGRVVLVFGLLWGAPIALLAAWRGTGSVLVQEGLLFSKAAMVTFGGAYSVLSYIAQQAVEVHGWLLPGQMLDGLGLAETTPGPLIMVVQFVGFLAAWSAHGDWSPLLAGTVGALVSTWVTFAPCFLWIFLGAPYIEALRGNQSLNHALSAITAAVVGVILNLSLWFALHTLFGRVDEVHFGGARLLVPAVETLDLPAAVLAAVALVAVLRFKVGVLLTLAAAGVLGIVLHPRV